MNENKYSDYVYIDAFFYSFWMKKSEFEKYKLQDLYEFKKKNFLSMHEYNKNISNI